MALGLGGGARKEAQKPNKTDQEFPEMQEGGGKRPLESPRLYARPPGRRAAVAVVVVTRPVVAGWHRERCVCVFVCACV